MKDNSLHVPRRLDWNWTHDANEHLGSRRQHISGLEVSGERDIELFSFEDLHRDPLFQNNENAQQASGNNQMSIQQHQYSSEGRQRHDCSMDVENDVEAPQIKQEDETQAPIIHRQPFLPAVENDLMDVEIKKLDDDDDSSDEYRLVSSPGSSNSSRNPSPAFGAKPIKECCSDLEAVELKRIELSICRSEENILMKSLEKSLCLMEERHVLKSLEVHIAKIERQLEELQNSENPNLSIKAELSVPRLLPESREEFITNEFLEECTKSFEGQRVNIANETTFKTYLMAIAGRPQTWKLCAEGPQETVLLFYVYWGKCFRERVLSFNIEKLRRDGIEVMLKLDVTQSLGVRVEYTDEQRGLFVTKKDDVFRGQLADVVSPENLAAGAVIVSVDGVEFKNGTELREHMEGVRKTGTKEIQIKLCLSRSVDLKRINQTAIVSSPEHEAIPLLLEEANHNTVSTMDQRRAITEDSQRRERRSPQDVAQCNAEEKSAANRSSKKRKEQDTVTDDAIPRKRVRNDQHIDKQTDASKKDTQESSSQSRFVTPRDQQSNRQVGGHERNLKSIVANAGPKVPEGGALNVDDASKRKGPSSQNSEHKDASIQPSRDEVAVGNESSVGRSVTNSAASVGWPRATLRNSEPKDASIQPPRDEVAAGNESLVGRSATNRAPSAVRWPRATLRNAEPKDASIQPSRDEVAVGNESSVGRSVTNSAASVGWPRATLRNSEPKDASIQPPRDEVAAGNESLVGRSATNSAANVTGRSQSILRNAKPKGGSIQPSSDELVADKESSVRQCATNSTASVVGSTTSKDSPTGSRRIGGALNPLQVEAQPPAADRRANVDTTIPHHKIIDLTRNEPIPPKENDMIDTHANVHIDTDDQESFNTKFDSDLPLGFYCIYDLTTRSCRVVSVCPTGQASRDGRIQPGTKLIEVQIEQKEAEKNTIVRQIWCPQDIKNHLSTARTKRLSVELLFANDSDNPYFMSFRGRFREAQWGDEGEWKGPNYAGWDGVLQREALTKKRRSAAVPFVTRKVHFSDEISTNDHVLPATSNLHFESLTDAVLRGSVYDLIKYVHRANTQDIGDSKRKEKREDLSIDYFKAALNLAKQNECTDSDKKEKLLKICARALQGISLAREYFRGSRTSTPDARQMRSKALNFIREGAASIQKFNKDLDESRGVKLSIDMHFKTENHFTLLHAAIELCDVPTFKTVLGAGADPFFETPFCSPFVMARQKVKELTDATGELQQQWKQMEEMLALMRKINTQRLANQEARHAKEVEPEVEGSPEPLLPDSDFLSSCEEMNVSERARTEPVIPSLDDANWLDLNTPGCRLCRHFEASQSCQHHDRCHFIHRYRSFGDQLSHILEKSRDHPVPDHDVDCFRVREETTSAGQVWFTSGYSSCAKVDKRQIFYAEGGQNGVCSSQNVWWYPTKADALLATRRVMAAYDWVTTVPHCRQTRVDMERLSDTFTLMSKREKGLCRYWPRCTRDAHWCHYFHGYGPFAEPGSSRKKNYHSDQHCNDAPYDVRFVQRKDLRDGRLYHTASYKRPNDGGIRFIHNHRGEGFYDSKNDLFWFDSEEQVRAAIASGI